MTDEEDYHPIIYMIVFGLLLSTAVFLVYHLTVMKHNADIAEAASEKLFKEQLVRMHCVNTGYMGYKSNRKIYLCDGKSYTKGNFGLREIVND